MALASTATCAYCGSLLALDAVTDEKYCRHVTCVRHGKVVAQAASAESVSNDTYSELRFVLGEALEQASGGKGKERHANEGERFEHQQIVRLGYWSGNAGFQIGQAIKKAMESQRLPADRAVAELLGAINYAAAAVVVIRQLSEAGKWPGDTKKESK